MESTVTGVVFDFGNVLYRVDYGSMAQRLADERAQELLAGFVGSSIQVAYETGRAGLDDVLRALSGMGFPLGRDRFLEAYLAIFTPVPGSREIVERLAERRPLGLLSNTSPDHAQLFIEKTPERALFSSRVYSFELGCMKPDARLYEESARRLGAPLRELAFTDDVEEYVAAAEALGMSGIWFRDSEDLRTRLASLGFDELA